MRLYRTRTQEEYDWLMQKLENEGYKWPPGDEPTEINHWNSHGVDTVIAKHPRDLVVTFADDYWAITEHPNEPIIEVSDLMDTVDHDTLMQKVLERNNKPDTVTNEKGHKVLEADKYARHKEITDFMHNTYVSKNKDYGNSFERTHKEIGDRASLGRIADKFYRLQNIILNDEQLVEDETVIDTLIDMANYAIMFAMELEEE